MLLVQGVKSNFSVVKVLFECSVLLGWVGECSVNVSFTNRMQLMASQRIAANHEEQA